MLFMSIKNKKVRVRFAPSPTGFLHIGGLRTALYNYLFAKRNKGKFILRIEDTDRERYVEGGIENIIGTLNGCGLKYDEGPDKKGKYGPYIQSERLEIYNKYIQELLEKGAAYYCFCSPENLDAERKEQQKKGLATKYSGRCLKLNKKSVQSKLKAGLPYVVRLKAPGKGTTVFEDAVYGRIEVKNKNIDHQILLKSDGFPTYHLANVVDDHLMQISHVIRGEEWLPSTPKHVLLYKAFGWQLPQFAHLPLLLNPDKSKLSKRQGDAAVEDYLRHGYLPEALLNFVALLGWNPKGDQEIYTIDELIKFFELKSVNKAGAVFSREKLYWMNGEYIRKKSLDDLVELCIPYLAEAGFIPDGQQDKKWLKKIIAAEHERLKRLDEIPQLTAFIFQDKLEYGRDVLIWKKSDAKEMKKNLELLVNYLVKFREKDFVKEKLEKRIKGFLAEKGIAAGNALWPMRVALSGLIASPPPFEIADILGKEKTLARLKDAIQKL